jgi:hypothetical protein
MQSAKLRLWTPGAKHRLRDQGRSGIKTTAQADHIP